MAGLDRSQTTGLDLPKNPPQGPSAQEIRLPNITLPSTPRMHQLNRRDCYSPIALHQVCQEGAYQICKTMPLGSPGPAKLEQLMRNRYRMCHMDPLQRTEQGQLDPRHVTFSDLPSQPMIGNQLNRGTRNSESPTPVREADVSSFVERLDYAGSNTYPYRKSSLPTDSLESFCPFNTRRAEHVIAIKKRELNADVAALKMLKSHPGSLGEQCRRFLHDSLKLVRPPNFPQHEQDHYQCPARQKRHSGQDS